ncbi:hypothetical protein IGI04_013031 [Brassica rapa subsp. trilocularis]|uniref:Uncharacterized protein n=1 Tax=Brassica rapa subsp. trilocularis TaxID=1813537 RepID=A0ABQ7N7N7_BRACM|nr:hypothetical protein IGI04_013031 [Brassica rapa subsp. trilocularis]
MVEFVYGLIKHLTHTLSQIDTTITKEINLYYYKESNLREFLATVHRHCYSLSNVRSWQGVLKDEDTCIFNTILYIQ